MPKTTPPRAGLAALLALLPLAACSSAPPSYGRDAAFLRRHTEVVELRAGGSRVSIAPAWQGRVMTSSCDGDAGRSHGWLNYALIEKGVRPFNERGDLEKHIHAFGGEERLWLGPEGGPYSFFFKPGAEQVFANWKTPDALDTEPFLLTAQTATSASFHRDAVLANAAGTELRVAIDRTVSLLGPGETGAITGTLPGAVRCVAYESVNTVTNTGAQAWNRGTGMPSIWMLGMMKPSGRTTVYIPFKPGTEAELGPKVVTSYFGDIPADRIRVTERGVFFKGDGGCRGKIGLPARRALPASGSFDAESGVLTLLVCDLPADCASRDYVCSLWGRQDRPFGGDVINSYNDGAAEPGKGQLGPFYELESSSPALALAPGQSQSHRQVTLHLSGPQADLDAVARRVLGVSLADMAGTLP